MACINLGLEPKHSGFRARLLFISPLPPFASDHASFCYWICMNMAFFTTDLSISKACVARCMSFSSTHTHFLKTNWLWACTEYCTKKLTGQETKCSDFGSKPNALSWAFCLVNCVTLRKLFTTLNPGSSSVNKEL